MTNETNIADMDLTAQTVNTLQALAKQHDVAGRSKMRKPELIAALGAIRDAAKPVDTFTIPGTATTVSGIAADVLRHHYAARERYTKDGRKNLTPAQRRRLHKKTNHYAAKVGFIQPKVKAHA